MANMWATLAIIHSKQYLDIATAETTFDADLTRLIEDVTARMIDYLDNDDIVDAVGNTILKHACATQVAYEWRRRKDTGLSSTTYPDGSTNKFTIDEWLPLVKEILNREKEWAI